MRKRETSLVKKGFYASNWFITSDKKTPKSKQELINKDQVLEDILAPFNNRPERSEQHQLQGCFVPGWKGESLISKNVKGFKDILKKFHQDARQTFYKKGTLSRKIKISIYDEFVSYSEYKAINCTDLDHYAKFWSELEDPESKYFNEISGFLDILSFRIAVVYLFKVRFIITLQNQTNDKFDLKNIYYPNSYFTKAFKIASSTELRTKAFEQNTFSWYRPSDSLKDELLKFKDISRVLQITEIIKTISTESEGILNNKAEYSHSISHKNFGLFLNSLVINLPQWLDSFNSNTHKKYKSQTSEMEIVSTKFTGDNLESLALSHWLAQQSNKNLEWEQIICPDFKRHEFGAGVYLKMINEIQFLTFLAEISQLHGREPKSFICTVVNSHLNNRKDSNITQRSLHTADTNTTFSTYDRVILNLSNFPKNNPQHFLFTQITSQKKFMKENSFLYVIAPKKLFVPSQKAKVESLLKEFKIEGVFNLEDVKGRGEVGAYVYIFSYKNNTRDQQPDEKHTCLNFRFEAELETFQEFSGITHLTQQFLHLNQNDIPPLYQKSLGKCRVEFNQDAIVEGQLFNSRNKGATNVPHPLFFGKLMRQCKPFDYFFDVQNVVFGEFQNPEEDSLFDFSNSFKREKSPYTIIVDQRNKEAVQIEVIPTNALDVKAYEYGHALCSYFYAYPKWGNINILTIRDFFESSIGKQIINLTFTNENRKVKGNLNTLLIPKYYISGEELPEHILSGLKLLTLGPQQILSLHPSDLDRQYKNIKAMLPNIITHYPAQILGLLSQFKRASYSALETIGCTKKSTSINFSNPILKTPLLLSKTFPIYPDNKDVYIDFASDGTQFIHSDLSKTKQIQTKKDGYISYGLELFVNQDQKVITIYSDENMINFMEFLLGNALNVPLSTILQGVQVPQLSELQSILASYQSLNRSLISLNTQVPADIDQLISSTILNSK